MSDETNKDAAPSEVVAEPAATETTKDTAPVAVVAEPVAAATETTKDAESAAVPAATTATPNADDTALITALTERLHFFFSNSNLRQDKWMRSQLANTNSLTLESLLRFKTIKNITEDKALVGKAAQGDSLKDLIVYDEEKEEVRRVVPFDWKTMGDGTHLSLYVKNVPLTEPDADKKESFRPRYAVTRDDIKALFEPYGRVGIVQLRFGRKPQGGNMNKEDEKYMSPNDRGYHGQSAPLGVAVVEFETVEGIEKAIKELIASEKKDVDDKKTEDADKETKEDDKMDTQSSTEVTVLEIKGNKLVCETMKPPRFSRDPDSNNKKRNRDNEESNGSNEVKEEEAPEEDIKFEPVTFDWEKGCVITLAGLNTSSCDRESLRDAVSTILGVSADVKTSGLYVDYNRGASTGNLRLKDATKSTEMKELVDKLNDGSVLIANEKVGSAKILEGEEEVQYWKDFVQFLNNRKKMREEEKRMMNRSNGNNKRQKFGGRGGGGRGRGGGRGGGRGRGRGRGGDRR